MPVVKNFIFRCISFQIHYSYSNLKFRKRFLKSNLSPLSTTSWNDNGQTNFINLIYFLYRCPLFSILCNKKNNNVLNIYTFCSSAHTNNLWNLKSEHWCKLSFKFMKNRMPLLLCLFPFFYFKLKKKCFLITWKKIYHLNLITYTLEHFAKKLKTSHIVNFF